MSFVRTVLGDVDASTLGLVYAHEHLIIDGPFVNGKFPEFRLDSVDNAVVEMDGLRRLGVGLMVDSMPMDAGRDVAKLAEASRRSGVHVVAPTGLHLSMYYPPEYGYEALDEAVLLERMVGEIGDGIESSPPKAGVVKVAGSRDRLTPAERRNFRAAARAQVATGCPILTHTEAGTAALEQIEILAENGADPSHVVLSHLDRHPDPAYHREALRRGVRLEYDSAFRWKGEENPTLDLILELAPEFPDSLMLGMDAARPAYWRSYGGEPGLAFLVETFAPRLRAAGLEDDLLHRILSANPAHAYAFRKTHA